MDQVLGKAVLELETDGTAMYRGLDEAKKRADTAGKDIAAALDKGGKRAAVGLAAMAAGAVAALNGTVQLGKGLREVNTMFGLTGAAAEKSFAELQKGTRDLSKEVGVAQTTITKGLYQAISAGVPRENVFEFLKVASQASIAGVTDVETAVDGLTTVINAYGLKASDAAAVSDALFTTVKGGKMTMADLSASLFNVAPAAAAAGVSLQETLAAVATLTSAGVPTAVATTQIRAALVGLQRPSEDLDAIAKRLGYSNMQAAIEAKGLAFALGAVKTAAGDDSGKLQTLLGSVEAVSAAQIIAGTGAAKMAEQMAAQTNAAGAASQAFKEMDESDARRLERSKIAVQNLALSLAKALTPAIETFANIVQTVTGYLDDHEKETKLVVAAVAALLAGIVAVNVALKVYNAFQAAAKLANVLWTASQWALNASIAATNGELTVLTRRLNALKLLGRVVVTVAVVYEVTKLIEELSGRSPQANGAIGGGPNPKTGEIVRTYDMNGKPLGYSRNLGNGILEPVTPTPGMIYTDNGKTMQVPGGQTFDFGDSLTRLTNNRKGGAGTVNRSAGFTPDPTPARKKKPAGAGAGSGGGSPAQVSVEHVMQPVKDMADQIDAALARIAASRKSAFDAFDVRHVNTQWGPLSGFSAASIEADKERAAQAAAALKAFSEAVEATNAETTDRLQAGIKNAIDAAQRAIDGRRAEFAGKFSTFAEAGLRAFDAVTSRMQADLARDLRSTLDAIEQARVAALPEEAAYSTFQRQRAAEARDRARAEAQAIADPVERAARLRELDLDDQERALAEAAAQARAAADERAKTAAAAAQSDYDRKRIALDAERALERDHFAGKLGELSTFLSTREASIDEANKRIAKLFEDFGVDPSFKQAGIDAGEGFATGLREKAAEALAALGVLTSTPAAPDLSTAAGALAAAFPNWHAFADGGIVTRPTYGVFGEAVPEAIIPLDKLNGLGGPDRIVLELDGRVITEVVRNQLGRFQQSNVSTGIV